MPLAEFDREKIIKFIIQEMARSEWGGTFEPKKIAERFKITTTTIYRYLNKLEMEDRITKVRNGRSYKYRLKDRIFEMKISIKGADEDAVWNTHISNFLDDIPVNAYNACYYIFTEMLNNAIDHSEGDEVSIKVLKNEYRSKFYLHDNGVGIFSKIAQTLSLSEKRFAILELSKGKFTTDPTNHSGEGIFFSSKAADTFGIFSDDLVFAANIRYSASVDVPSTYMIWDHKFIGDGTLVGFTVNHNHLISMSEIFDKFTSESEDYGFTKTTIPVNLVEYGKDNPIFVSRSQAKRLLSRIEKFKDIILDFSGVDSIGQGFADEIFRVFVNRQPDVDLKPVNCNESVTKMIKHVSKS